MLLQNAQMHQLLLTQLVAGALNPGPEWAGPEVCESGAQGGVLSGGRGPTWRKKGQVQSSRKLTYSLLAESLWHLLCAKAGCPVPRLH